MHLDHISQQYFQSLLLRRAHDTLAQLGSHARVQLYCYTFLRLFEDADREVTGAGADFEDDVGLVELGFLDYGVCYTGVLEDVLAGNMLSVYTAKEWGV